VTFLVGFISGVAFVIVLVAFLAFGEFLRPKKKQVS
jgi:hypothetical protein